MWLPSAVRVGLLSELSSVVRSIAHIAVAHGLPQAVDRAQIGLPEAWLHSLLASGTTGGAGRGS